MIPDQYLDLLAPETKSMANVATVGPQGEPRCTPVWFYWDGEYISISLLSHRQKFQNMTREPRVSVTILHPDNPYRYVEIRGVVDQIEDDPDAELTHVLAKKYLDQDRFAGHQPGEDRKLVRIRPTKITGMG